MHHIWELTESVQEPGDSSLLYAHNIAEVHATLGEAKTCTT